MAASAMEVDGPEAAANGQMRPRCMSSYVDEGSTESHRYYLARRTLLEMLRDRGYAIASSEIDISLAEFRASHGQSPDIDRLRISNSLRSDPSKRVLAYFCNPGPVKVNSIRYISGQIANKEGLSGLILVLQGEMTNQALKSLDLFSFKVEVFQITDLLVNITKHVLKPKHRVLTDQEKQNLLKKYSIQEKQFHCIKLLSGKELTVVLDTPVGYCLDFKLPRMLKNDAIARYYGLEKGQVVKVTYSGDITGTHVTYRCVW